MQTLQHDGRVRLLEESFESADHVLHPPNIINRWAFRMGAIRMR